MTTGAIILMIYSNTSGLKSIFDYINGSEFFVVFNFGVQFFFSAGSFANQVYSPQTLNLAK